MVLTAAIDIAKYSAFLNKIRCRSALAKQTRSGSLLIMTPPGVAPVPPCSHMAVFEKEGEVLCKTRKAIDTTIAITQSSKAATSVSLDLLIVVFDFILLLMVNILAC